MKKENIKLRPLLPSLRARKRYLAFEVISNDQISDYAAVSAQIMKTSLELFGSFGVAAAGMHLMPEKFKNQKGIIRVNHRYVNHVKVMMSFIKEVRKSNVSVRTLGVSGMINKAEKRYLAS